jgi:hypothetical protein
MVIEQVVLCISDEMSGGASYGAVRHSDAGNDLRHGTISFDESVRISH